MNRTIIINDDIYLLPEGESWNIYKDHNTINNIVFMRLACNNKFLTEVKECNRDVVINAIIQGIKEKKEFIQIIVKQEITVETY